MTKRRQKKGMSLKERRAKEKFDAMMDATGKMWHIQDKGEAEVELTDVWIYFCNEEGRTMAMSQLSRESMELYQNVPAGTAGETVSGLQPLRNLISQGFIGGKDMADAMGYVGQYFFGSQLGQQIKQLYKDGRQGLHLFVITWVAPETGFWAKPGAAVKPGLMTPDEVKENVLATVEHEKVAHSERFH